MYYLANYNEKQKIHRGEQTNAFPSWQLTGGLEPGNRYSRVWEFPWLPLQINHPLADVFIGYPAAGSDPGRGNPPKSQGEEWTGDLCFGMTPTCSPGGKPPDSLDAGAPGCWQEGQGGSQSSMFVLRARQESWAGTLQSIHPSV